jgi:type IV pilus assembly protein PilB
MKIGKYLVEKGFLTKEELEIASGYQKRWSVSLELALLSQGYVTESTLAYAIASSYGLPLVDLAKRSIQPEALRLVPAHIAEKEDILPFWLRKNIQNPLAVAIAQPATLNIISKIEFLTGHKIQPYVARYTALINAIAKFYRKESVKIPELGFPGQPEKEIREESMIIERLGGKEEIIN